MVMRDLNLPFQTINYILVHYVCKCNAGTVQAKISVKKTANDSIQFISDASTALIAITAIEIYGIV